MSGPPGGMELMDDEKIDQLEYQDAHTYLLKRTTIGKDGWVSFFGSLFVNILKLNFCLIRKANVLGQIHWSCRALGRTSKVHSIVPQGRTCNQLLLFFLQKITAMAWSPFWFPCSNKQIHVRFSKLSDVDAVNQCFVDGHDIETISSTLFFTMFKCLNVWISHFLKQSKNTQFFTIFFKTWTVSFMYQT